MSVSDIFSLAPVSVIRGLGAEVGAGHHGAGEAGERAGRLSPGRPALPAGLLPGQDSRSVKKLSDDTFALCHE